MLVHLLFINIIINKTYDNTWLFRKKSDKPWPNVNDIILDKQKILFKCKHNEKTFNSMRDLARYLNVNLSVVQRIMKNNATYNGCSANYIT